MTSQAPQRAWRQSVFWRVAAVVLGAQLLAVAVAVGLSFRAAADRAYDLAAEGVRLRLDAVAEEIELRADWGAGGLSDLQPALLADLSSRFPDTLVVVDALGFPVVVATARGAVPAPAGFSGLPPDLRTTLEEGVIVADPDRAWMAAPVYDDVGFLSGGIVIKPLERSLDRELAPARTAIIRAFATSGIAVLLVALGLAALFTLTLVRPLRQMIHQVEGIGNGDYEGRVDYPRRDELGLLATTINEMAERVSASISELQATDRIRRELVANVGHDLRTPLAAVLGRVDEAGRMLSQGQPDEAAAQLAKAGKQATYLTRLVDDLFELSMLDTPSPRLRREPIPIAELIQDATEQVKDELRRKEVGLSVDIQADIPLLDGDGVRLLRLLGNLLSNAARHTPQGGVVAVEGKVEGSDLVVCVKDTGPGIEEEAFGHLFERYYRGSDARTRGGAGTGLGLAISRAVARAHGGDLIAANRAQGGAEFTLTLPLA